MRSQVSESPSSSDSRVAVLVDISLNIVANLKIVQCFLRAFEFSAVLRGSRPVLAGVGHRRRSEYQGSHPLVVEVDVPLSELLLRREHVLQQLRDEFMRAFGIWGARWL